MLFAVTWLILGLTAGCAQPIANRDSKGEAIICFGDSLTQGQGAEAGRDYPAQLARILGRPVVNAGSSGETTRDALMRIDRDVLLKNPRLVVVEFGGNDFLKNVSLEETLRNLDEVVGRIEDAGAMVALAEVRTAIFTDPYLEGFRQIARKRKALLIPDLLKGIMDNASLKSDHIHPNAEGYRVMAQRVYKYIKPLVAGPGIK